MDFTMRPVAFVRGGRATLEDDGWGGTEVAIELAPELPDAALDGIEAFSHAEVLYVFDRVRDDEIARGARRPRGNPAWPEVGILAQRAKARPNRIGATIVRVVGREGRVLRVAELDAVDGTPVLDVKPVMREFLPRGEVTQPSWATALMARYY